LNASPPDVVGVAEIAKLFGVARNTAWRWAQRDGFPEPARLAAGPVWRRRDVERWAERELPLPEGRPSKGR
jgi:predicted DNA-binding transcriptional regulator AlpA